MPFSLVPSITQVVADPSRSHNVPTLHTGATPAVFFSSVDHTRFTYYVAHTSSAHRYNAPLSDEMLLALPIVLVSTGLHIYYPYRAAEGKATATESADEKKKKK